MAWFLNFYSAIAANVVGPMNGPACATTNARIVARAT